VSLRVYNTLTREKEPFEPVRPDRVGIYLCGPTVYKSPHIGHMVGPLIFDAIKRYLTFVGYNVTWVVNITDVDDKLIDTAAETRLSVEAIATKYAGEYHDALDQLGVRSIDLFPKASEHMPQIIAMIETLVSKGHAYPAGGGVWFDVATDPNYGRLSGRNLDEQSAGTRTLEGEGKKSPADFALWKAAKEGEVSWDSPWGRGRPGWHIECSAMSQQYLGDTFDFHGGGLDLLFPHHENELAQSCCATGQPFARFWLHNGLTRVRTKLAGAEYSMQKMSKSLGNVVSVADLLREHGPALLRYLILRTHYRRPIEFTDEAMAESKKAFAAFVNLFEKHETTDVAIDGPETAKFFAAMDDDFNTAAAIASLHELTSQANGASPDEAKRLASVVKKLGNLLGLFEQMPQVDAPSDSLAEPLMQLIIKLRKEARASKNFALADAIRNGLTEIGITLEDRADGTGWKKT
jgi:cysteinyl-tRNA synthetase